MKIGCSIIIVMWLLAGCAYNDHSRTFNQVVDCDGDVIIDTEVLLEKSGVESSKADQEATPSFSIPASVL